MLMLIDMLKAKDEIKFDNDFCKAVGILKPNLCKIRHGEKHFTPVHIGMAVLKFRVNANWIFGASDIIFSTPKSTLFNKIKQ